MFAKEFDQRLGIAVDQALFEDSDPHLAIVNTLVAGAFKTGKARAHQPEHHRVGVLPMGEPMAKHPKLQTHIGTVEGSVGGRLCDLSPKRGAQLLVRIEKEDPLKSIGQ